MKINCGHCGGVHESVAEVKNCSGVNRTFTEQDERDMQRMEAEGDYADTIRDEEAKAAWKATVETYDRPFRPSAVTVTAEGLYRLDGQLYQVLRGKDSGRLYAKLVTFPPAGSQARPTLAYAKGVIFDLTPADLVPIDEAQEITRKTGWCVFGHYLTNPESIKRGMGPVCYARYPHLAKDAVAS